MFYLDTKIPEPPEPSEIADPTNDDDNAAETKNSQAHKAKIVATLRSCAELLQSSAATNASSGSGSTDVQQRRREELIRIDKKLYQCRIPEKMDLVGINKAQKRDGIEPDGKLDGGVAKKRKLERERLERDGGDLFGPALGT